MKKINFTNAGGFPLEQETLARLQAAYKDELYEMLKRNFDISNDQNYILSEPTDTLNGWFVINGILHLMEPGAFAPTNFIKTSETITKLRFGDGVYQPAYTDYTVEYINGDEVPVGYFDDVANDSNIEVNGLQDFSIALPNERKLRYYDITNLSNNPDRFQRIGFLPINGSKPMEGDLDMGGNQLSNLDTLETALATLRAKFFNFGFSAERGAPGRALVDESLSVDMQVDRDTALHLNYNSDWEKTVIGGEIILPEFAENSTSLRKSPLLIDSKGNVCKGSASENIPLGLIALWYNANQPIPPGWVLCNAANEGLIGNITVPNLSSNQLTPTTVDAPVADVNTVDYIIYVGRDTPTINALIVDTLRNSKTVERTLSSGQTSFDATANPFQLEATLENLTLQGWTQVSGPPSATITTPNSENTTITGNLAIGAYVYQVSGVDTLGAVFTDQVTITIRESNMPPVFNSIVNTTSGVNVTNDMNIELTSNLILQEDISSELIDSQLNRASQDQADTDIIDVSRQQVLGRAAFRVGVSDPDGNIFSPNVSVVARIRRADGTVQVIQPVLIEDVSTSSVSSSVDQSLVRFFDFRILGLTATDILEFVATDEGGAETVKSYTISFNIEPSISLSQTGPTLTTVTGDKAKFFDVRIQGTPNATVSLVASRLLSSAVASVITITNTGTSPASFTLNTINTPFNVLLDATGVRTIRVTHQMTIPSLTTINNGTTYTLNSRIELASNSSNGLNLRFAFTLTGLIDIEPIDDTPIDDFPIGGGGGGCFDVNTYVSLASGHAKKLKNVELGEMLVGLDFPNRTDASSGNYFNWIGKLSEAVETPVKVINKRTLTVASYFEIVTKDGRVLKVTGDHPLLASRDGSQVQWLPAQSINEAMSLVDKKGTLKGVQSITWISEPLEVATIDVEDVDNYVIAGVVAHNKEIISEEIESPQVR
ncbi:hypothetical protein ACFO3O_19955 [Dokdonia ponticola]|uniref:Hint domain-containing protein n=1 Tax=Dokdonia ponticola TaxID=2041041 RepID=A0ABV9I258_9FLAO